MHSTVVEQLATLETEVSRALAAANYTAMTHDERVTFLQHKERIIRRLQNADNQILPVLTQENTPAAFGYKNTRQLLQHTLLISGPDAGARVAAACELGPRVTPTGLPLEPTLPVAGTAAQYGNVSKDHTYALRAVMRKIPAAVNIVDRDFAEATLTQVATQACPEDVTKAGLQILAHLDPDGKLSDETDRKRQRTITFGKQGADGMSKLSGQVTPELRALAEAWFVKHAAPGHCNPEDADSPHPGTPMNGERTKAAAGRDTRSAGQRNHDAMIALLNLALGSDVLGTHRGLPVQAIVTFNLAQLEGAIGGAATTATGGVIPISDALRMAENTHPVLVVFDHNGRPLHLGRVRLASPDQRLALIAAEGGCTRAGCDAPAAYCAVHHAEKDYAKGGLTNIDDLTLACDSCNSSVNDSANGWQTVKAPPGHRYAGQWSWIPPAHVDPERKPRFNYRHKAAELFAMFVRHARRQREHDPPHR